MCASALMRGMKYVCLLSMFILHSRESELYRCLFGWDVRTLLGAVIFEVSGPSVFHIKMVSFRKVPCP